MIYKNLDNLFGIVLCFVLFFVGDVCSLPQRHQGRYLYDGKSLEESMKQGLQDGPAPSLYFEQSLDHFNRQDLRTFQ